MRVINRKSRRGRNFLDRADVIRILGARLARNLSAWGAGVRREALDLVKERKGRSRPGEPPRSHMREKRAKIRRARKARGLTTGPQNFPGSLNPGFKGMRQITFYFDRRQKRVVIGPESAVGGYVTNILEFGGEREVGRQGTKTPGHLASRPYMSPALQRYIGKAKFI